ncbi:MAG TPA: glycosyltransferase, partial [Candidatus Paceibacterota bacterium]|nr:glycosyltransferase [Candidatus Paceibacterota bacterium]
YGGAKEAVIDGVTGFVLDPFDTEKMAKKVRELLNDKDKATSFGQAGRVRIEAKFNLNDKIREYLRAYEVLY